MCEVWELVKEMTQPTRSKRVVGVGQVARAMRVSERLVYAWGEEQGRLFPAAHVGGLTAVTGDYLLIERLAEACGGVFLRLPEGRRNIEVASEMLERFSGTLKSYSDATAEDSEGGRHWTLGEVDEFKQHAQKVVQAILGAVAEAEADCAAQRVRDGRAASLAAGGGAGIMSTDFHGQTGTDTDRGGGVTPAQIRVVERILEENGDAGNTRFKFLMAHEVDALEGLLMCVAENAHFLAMPSHAAGGPSPAPGRTFITPTPAGASVSVLRGRSGQLCECGERT